MKLLVFANPENRRVGLLQEAAAKTEWQVKVIAYERLLRNEVDLLREAADCTAARIESPGENFAVEKLLLQRGAKPASERGCAHLENHHIERLEEELGRIHFPYQYFLGFQSLLFQLDAEIGVTVPWMNSPQAVASMFEKPATLRLLQAHQIPTALFLGPIHSFEQLNEITKDHPRVFVKLATSSSASGVCAVFRRKDKWRVTTTVELVESNRQTRLYNTLKLRQLDDPKDIEQLINELAPHQLIAEKWLPKAAYDHRRTFDLRVVVIDGQTTHFVPRVSSSPLTNLHLANQRGDWQKVQQRIGTSLNELNESCSRAVNAIPGTFYAGLDIVVDPRFRKFSVLEANACGDLLPGLLNSNNESTYEAELRLLKEKLNCL